MTAKRKHKSSNEYLKYLKGKLSSEERYAFERDLEADPFEREALEGMEQIPANSLEEDLLSLHASLEKRLSRKKRPTWYYVAATVASLLIVATVFINIYDINPKTASESIPSDESFLHEDEALQKELKMQNIADQEEEKAETIIRKEAETTEVMTEEADAVEARADETDALEARANEAEMLDFAETRAPAPAAPMEAAPEVVAREVVAREKADEVVAPEVVAVEAQPKRTQKKGGAEKAAAPLSYTSEFSTERIGGIVLSAKDMEPLPGASIVVKGSDSGLVSGMDGRFSLIADQQEPSTIIASYVGMETEEYQLARGLENQVVMQPDLAALNEVVVIGYDANKSEYAAGAVQPVKLDQEKFTYSGAAPEGGLQAYKMYIEEQIRFPAGDTLSKREVVVLKFIVARDGSVSDIQTLRSPGMEFTEEAIRLLQEGPAWTPARNEHGTTDDVVRMRIVFKRSS